MYLVASVHPSVYVSVALSELSCLCVWLDECLRILDIHGAKNQTP